MAIQTKNIAVLPWDETLVALVDITYDDVDLRVRSIIVTNPAPRDLIITAARVDRSRVYSQTFPANQTTTLPIPTTAPNRLQLTVTPNGRLDGVEYTTAWAAA